jgi:calcineurin-like phosphoesterase family protein
MLHTHPIPSHLTRHNAVGKQRRPVGDPVAALKDMTRFIPIPQSAPGRLSAPFSIFDPKASQAALKAGKLVFHCVGDTGGIHGTATEEAIAVAMEDQIKSAPTDATPAFFYNLGDVIYFNGQSTLYKSEFYEPYQYYPALIFAIPGNHDGDTQVFKGDAPDTEPSLFGFFQNFCAPAPEHVSPYRMSMTQPYVYWTLDAPFVTIVGLYSNVEGSLDARGRMDQQSYLEQQMAAAPADKKLLMAVHHPPFSLDSVHGGTPDILNALDRAIVVSGRVPDAVLSGHVHNYQRFTREVKGRKIPYVVAGAGGYANDARSMHKIQKELVGVKLPYQTTHPDVQFEAYEEEQPGFLRITASAGEIQFEYFRVPFGGEAEQKPFDTFTA